jgi:transposase
VHALVTSRGDVVRYTLTGGQVGDITQAIGLVGQGGDHSLVGDRAYDSEAFVAHVRGEGMAAIIPSRARRKAPRPLDRSAYAVRNVIERFFGRIKQFRRVATRYDKTTPSYAGQVSLATALVSLSGWSA